jgi:hypothetical protein
LTEFIEAIIDPLDKTVNKKAPAASSSSAATTGAGAGAAGAGAGDGPSAVELDRQQDVAKSAVRVVYYVNQLPVAQLVRRWVEFVDRLNRQQSTQQMLQQVAGERAGDL